MKAKMKIKFDLNESIKRLEEITKGFQASAQRMQILIDKMDESKKKIEELNKI